MTWYDHYLNYANVNESPRTFHQWSGLALMSSIIGRRVWTDMSMFTVYPQMYVVLTSPPGVAKSTAMDVAKDFARDHVKDIAMSPAAITKEAMTKMMAGDTGSHIQQFTYQEKTIKFSQLSIFADEIVSLLMCGGAPTVMIDFLTEIFNGKTYRETTKNKGDHEIKNPYISILACCTIQTIRDLMYQKVVSGGMARRCLFVVEKRNSSPVPEIVFTEDQLWSRKFCQDTWQKLRLMNGQFTWTFDAKMLYHKWYRENFARIDRETSEVTQHFLRTKPVYCIKVSMVLACAAEHPELKHTEETFSRAIDLVTEIERGAAILFDQPARNELIGLSDKICYYMERVKTCSAKDLRREFFRECKDFNTLEIDRCMDYLISERYVRAELKGSEKIYIFIGTERPSNEV